MNAAAAAKPCAMNFLEGMALIAIFQALPTFSGGALLLKLLGYDAGGMAGGAAVLVVLSSFDYAPLAAQLGPRLSKTLSHIREPLFFDATLSFREKITRWRMQPAASLQLATNVVMLSMLAAAVVWVGYGFPPDTKPVACSLERMTDQSATITFTE
jgi:hypothetical protein